ncbi:hypothetical protein [Marinobacter xestospongiae]|uniref:hypothetical protein n=1 Tax=Marinobacter xestospongiae TaxID=994319 RepID=UPI002003A540|nr:hypothetical protein [Marinobacter xestospongiae]MCK7569184.1 hypothetical protein [Marinobacter xestospongiae]
MKMAITFTLTSMLLMPLTFPLAYSQDTANVISEEQQNIPPEPKRLPAPQKGSSAKVGWLSSFEFGMSISVLVFGLLVFAVEYVLIRSIEFEPEQSIKLIVVTLIVISTLFIITAGFDSEQIAPAMGLFGTIAGYMLGRANSKEAHEEQGK